MPKKIPSSHKDLAPIPVRGWNFFVRVICLHLPTWALYVSTIVRPVLVPNYLHADMSATHENDTTLTGQKWNKKGRCCRMSGRHFPTFLRHIVRHVNVASKLPMLTSDKPNYLRFHKSASLQDSEPSWDTVWTCLGVGLIKYQFSSPTH